MYYHTKEDTINTRDSTVLIQFLELSYKSYVNRFSFIVNRIRRPSLKKKLNSKEDSKNLSVLGFLMSMLYN